MSLARAEQDADVTGPRSAGDARVLVAHRGAPEQANDLRRDSFRADHRVGIHHQAEHGVTTPARLSLDREPVALSVLERVVTALHLRHGGKQVIREREERGHRTKALADGAANVWLLADPRDLPRRTRDDRRVRVAEPIDGLLAIPYDEDRGREREVLPKTDARAPGLHEPPHQVPLCLARVLELVDEQVVIAGLEQISALGELVHLLEQRQRAPQRVGEIDYRVGGQRAPVLLERDREQARHPAREDDVQVAPEAGQVVTQPRSEPHGPLAVAPPRIGRVAVLGAVTPARARLAGPREEVILKLVEQRPHALETQGVRGLRICRRVEDQTFDFGSEEREPRPVVRAVREEPRKAPLDGAERCADPVDRPPAHVRRGEIGGALDEESTQPFAGDEAPLEEHGKALA